MTFESGRGGGAAGVHLLRSSAKLLGLPLEEIRELLDIREKAVCAPARVRMRALVADRIADTDARIAEPAAFLLPPGRRPRRPGGPGSRWRVRTGLRLTFPADPGLAGRLAVLAAAAVTALVAVRRRRRTAACSTTLAKADLGMPSLGPPDGNDTTTR